MKEPSRSFLRLFSPPNPFWSLPRLYWFLRDYRNYVRLSGQKIGYHNLWPFLNDKTDTTPIGYYFYQDTWAFHKIAKALPVTHVDVGSTALLVGCLAGIVPTVSVDIRPLDVSLPGLTHKHGSIIELPFETGTVESISSLCVVEHIGLGRYGDPLDPLGSEKAGHELARVLQPGGSLYVSLPIGVKTITKFNAHRIFNEGDALALFPGLTLQGYVLVGNKGILSSLENADVEDFPVGLFHLTKPEINKGE